MQTLLAERFHLKAHTEMKEMPVYALVVAKGGWESVAFCRIPRARESFGGQRPSVEPPGEGHFGKQGAKREPRPVRVNDFETLRGGV
jgi:uncharacterized protein (TIGR03435 family)